MNFLKFYVVGKRAPENNHWWAKKRVKFLFFVFYRLNLDYFESDWYENSHVWSTYASVRLTKTKFSCAHSKGLWAPIQTQKWLFLAHQWLFSGAFFTHDIKLMKIYFNQTLTLTQRTCMWILMTIQLKIGEIWANKAKKEGISYDFPLKTVFFLNALFT